ncbi:MAG: class I SAM-dependent methyltransferase [Actinobacteria bacterium]|nr:class I SAM-dependent methyltransferase [Actinomycetota bacterium]MBU1944541.1 class I SAM-dependent methyltransferase [Actinomycetota bacterium]MBU2689094.1 class I SAM-dependent methyltransferase [Actinomycetota bacterium]
MIFHRLVARFLKHGDDEEFYCIQAEDAARWLERAGVRLAPGLRVLDLGCGLGLIGGELAKRGCEVTLADETDVRLPRYREFDYREVDIETEDLARLGSYDLVVCSNVLEHLARPERLLGAIPAMLRPGGKYYLSWTNWYSPWGGHEYSPFHYLGKRRGYLIYDRLFHRRRNHTPFVNLFPTSIAGVLGRIRRNPRLRVVAVVPRYYPELSFVTRVPLLREFLTWNCAILIELVTKPCSDTASTGAGEGG